MKQNHEISSQKPRLANPLAGWVTAFRRDFRVSKLWFQSLGLSLVALIWKLISKAPTRLGRLVKHLGKGLWGALKWSLIDSIRAVKRPEPGSGTQSKGELDGRTRSGAVDERLRTWFRYGVGHGAAWLGRLIAKLADLVSLGELIDLLSLILKFNTRPLSEVEIQEARRVFGDSLTYWRIRLDEWSIIAHIGKWVSEKRLGAPVGDMAVTLFSTIHFSRRIKPEPGNNDMAWLIHELTHVAQMEHVGSQFLGEALHAQVTEGYNYGGAEALISRDISDFNREQQGDIAKDYYKSLTGTLSLSEHQRKAYQRIIGQIRSGKL